MCALRVKCAIKFRWSNILNQTDVNKVVLLNKDLSNIENSKDVTNNSFIRKNVSILQERAEESDAIIDDQVKQTSKLKIFKQKKKILQRP